MFDSKKLKTVSGVLAPIALGVVLASCSPNMGKRNPSDDGESVRSAYQIYAELQEASTSFNAKGVMVGEDMAIDGLGAGVTFGAEKEASSSLLTRIMTPSGEGFKSFVSNLGEAERKEFLSDFMDNYLKNANGYRTYRNKEGVKVDLASDVVDIEGNQKLINLDELRGIDYKTAELSVLEEKFAKFVDMTDDRPLSFIKPAVRSKLFNGKLPGLTSSTGLNPTKGRGPSFTQWSVIFGKAQKYISDAHGHNGGGGGWEINFIPQKSYGEFEEMVMWFRTELENAGKLFQAPGHQRMVFMEHPNLKKKKLAETYKMIQALIVVDGIKGKTGIEKANYKTVQTDAKLQSLDTYRGVIRLEGPRWGAGTHGIEFRAGTKDIKAARFYQTVLTARVASNDWSGLSKVDDWTLYDGNSPSGSKLAATFGVDSELGDKAIRNLQAAGIKDSFMLPFWGWLDAPFISDPKKEMMKSLTRDFITQVASLGESDQSSARELLRTWTKSTRLSEEIREYLRPKRGLETAEDILHFNPPSGRALVSNLVDVNNIDLGIEYSGKLPLKLQGDFSAERLPDNKKAWIRTKVDLTDQERELLIKKVAKDLSDELGGTGEPEKVAAEVGGHGHGLELSYSIKDSQNRKWVVEWDGIGRTYTPAGDVLEGSPRAGSIELVTPKFTPSIDEMDAVYKAFEKNSIMPSHLTGGGHINIDLAAFEGKPKALARFMTIFNEHRGVIALMFQNVNRLKSAQPAELSSNLVNALKDFNGSEEDLKKLLYNEQYFNTRYGRKTRYIQLDMSAYFQDVIPEQFVTDDFDIASPAVEWRRQFRVDPNIRKAEFRLFDAPRDAMESALQIRLVRAMLSKALNEEGALSGAVQTVDHVAYSKNPAKAAQDLEKLCTDLGLEIDDYRPALAEGLSETDLATRSIFFTSLEEKLALHPKQPGWGEAVAPRSEPIGSEGRAWSPGEADRLNTMTNEHRVQAAEAGERIRNSITPDREIPGAFKRTDSCVEALAGFL